MNNNTEVKRCHCCNGTKKIRGLGNMEKQCPECSGIGWVATHQIEVKKSEESTKLEEISSKLVLGKKRGPKSKAAAK